MATFIIYYGAEKPIIAVGIHQVKLLQFAEKFQCKHYFDKKDKNRVRAIQGLERKRCLVVDWNNYTFKFQYSH